MCAKMLDSTAIASQDGSRYTASCGIRDLCAILRVAARGALDSPGFFRSASAEVVRSAIGRVDHHHTVSGQPPDARTPAPARVPTRSKPWARRRRGHDPGRGGSAARLRVVRPRLGLRRSDHRSGDSPTMSWYRVSFGMLKHPPTGRVDSSRVSDAPPRMLSTGSGFGDVGDRFTTRRRLRWSAHGSGDCPTTA